MQRDSCCCAVLCCAVQGVGMMLVSTASAEDIAVPGDAAFVQHPVVESPAHIAADA